jgi:hypothetical protein
MQAVAVEVFGFATEAGDEDALVVVARLPDAAVRKCSLGNQRDAKMVLVRD